MLEDQWSISWRRREVEGRLADSFRTSTNHPLSLVGSWEEFKWQQGTQIRNLKKKTRHFLSSFKTQKKAVKNYFLCMSLRFLFIPPWDDLVLSLSEGKVWDSITFQGPFLAHKVLIRKHQCLEGNGREGYQVGSKQICLRITVGNWQHQRDMIQLRTSWTMSSTHPKQTQTHERSQELWATQQQKQDHFLKETLKSMWSWSNETQVLF